MKRFIMLGVIILAGVLFVGAGVVSGKEIDIGGETLTLKISEGKKPALFPHRYHQEIMSCMECHHLKDQTITVNKCVACHNSNLKSDKYNSFKKVAHSKCRGCHKAAKKEGKEAPVKCSGCHPMQIK